MCGTKRCPQSRPTRRFLVCPATVPSSPSSVGGTPFKGSNPRQLHTLSPLAPATVVAIWMDRSRRDGSFGIFSFFSSCSIYWRRVIPPSVYDSLIRPVGSNRNFESYIAQLSQWGSSAARPQQSRKIPAKQRRKSSQTSSKKK